VVSVGNLAVGGTGKTTLTLHLAASLAARGVNAAVVCRRYRPGPSGRGDEELLYARALGLERVFAGRHKWKSALEASGAGFSALLVDDGFSHWRLERDLDLVLVDARDPWAGGLLPAGRLREPLRALARADIVVLSHADQVPDLGAACAAVQRVAPAALLAAGRHRVTGLRRLADGGSALARGAAHVVTGTGNPASVERATRASGFEWVSRSDYRDHHWFTADEARREHQRASVQGAVIVLTAKDAVRWPIAGDPQARVLEVEWEWMAAGDEVESRVADALRHDAAPVARA
jgi:tetraacyldisaccharide 4'-kinase